MRISDWSSDVCSSDLLPLHEARQPLLLHVLVDRVRQLVGLRTFHRRVGERADAVELRLVEEIQQLLELGLSLARKADDEGGADGEVRADRTPATDAFKRLCRSDGRRVGKEGVGKCRNRVSA